MNNRNATARRKTFAAAGALLLALTLPSFAAFNSGSTGEDGALNITASGVTIFDPRARGIDLDSDNVFHFTTINISSGSTLKLSADVMGSRPVTFLASGNVTISGIIDLNGENGHAYGSAHRPSVAGAGGFSGGIGVQPGLMSATSGEGPGGGVVGGGGNSTCGTGAGGGYRLAGNTTSCTGTCCAQGGKAYGNKYLLPLIGGSGGSGSSYENGWINGIGTGGGAGGGALLIASSGSITVSNSITARGGSGVYGYSIMSGGGSGGAVRLVANAINGGGTIQVHGGSGGGNGSAGYIRLESYATTIPLSNLQPMGILATPGLPLFPEPGSLPSVKILSIDGIPAPSNPTGTYTVPDMTINRGDSCTIVIEARNIPVGTVVNLTMSSEDDGNFFLVTTPLAGTLSASTATARTRIPTGYSRFNLNATW